MEAEKVISWGGGPPSNPRALACLVPRDSELAFLLRSLIKRSPPPPEAGGRVGKRNKRKRETKEYKKKSKLAPLLYTGKPLKYASVGWWRDDDKHVDIQERRAARQD